VNPALNILWRLARLLSPLLAVALAACGGGGDEAAQVQPVQRQWQVVPPPGQAMTGFGSCGAGIVKYVFSPNNPENGAEISFDHGATWLHSGLGGAQKELGDTGNYWQRPNPFGRPPLTDEETTDCGVTWTPISPSLRVCLQGNSPLDLWRGGDSNQILFAETVSSGSAPVYPVCMSSDNGQSWTPGPELPAAVTVIRGKHWFAISSPANTTSGSSLPDVLLQSDDQGVTWQQSVLANSTGRLSIVSGPVMYAIGMTQASAVGQAVWRWSDADATWSAIASTFPAATDNGSIIYLVVNPAATSQIFISTTTTVLESRDAARTWSGASSGLTGPPGDQLVFDPTQANRLYAATFGGLFALDTSLQ
jgi:hypothetical protein